ncbi:uncharacterized, partial [Tachysurus ichikawai]
EVYQLGQEVITYLQVTLVGSKTVHLRRLGGKTDDRFRTLRSLPPADDIDNVGPRLHPLPLSNKY